MIVPTKEEVSARVTEDPTAQNTLVATAPLDNMICVVVEVVTYVDVWNTHTPVLLPAPYPERVSDPVVNRKYPAVLQYTPGANVRPDRSGLASNPAPVHDCAVSWLYAIPLSLSHAVVNGSAGV